jgi:hypothetical protein
MRSTLGFFTISDEEMQVPGRERSLHRQGVAGPNDRVARPTEKSPL